MEFGTLIPAIPLLEKSQKECGLRMKRNSREHISESKEISISSKLGTIPLHQLFEVLHKIDIILDKVQVANTPPNQHSSGVDLPKLYKNESKFY